MTGHEPGSREISRAAEGHAVGQDAESSPPTQPLKAQCPETSDPAKWG